MNRKPQLRRQHRQHEQDHEQHPYMSLYEPVLLETGIGAVKAEADACLSSSSSSWSSQQEQQPEEVSSSSYATVTEQSPSMTSRSRINDTSSSIDIDINIDRAKKRQKIDFSYENNNNNNNNNSNNIAEQVDHILKTFLDDYDDADADVDADANIGINNVVDIERMKLATKKNQKMNSKRHYASTFSTATTTARSIGNESNKNCSDSGSSSNNNNNATIRRINTKTNYAKWMEMYQRLVAYKKEHNDTNVPQRYNKDPKLGSWVCTQRGLYRDKKITEERKRFLNSVGFGWDVRASWEEMYQRLVAYKKIHKHTKVLIRYKEDPQFGAWVSTQRRFYKKNKMLEERKCRLNSIGFAWK